MNFSRGPFITHHVLRGAVRVTAARFVRGVRFYHYYLLDDRTRLTGASGWCKASMLFGGAP